MWVLLNMRVLCVVLILILFLCLPFFTLLLIGMLENEEVLYACFGMEIRLSLCICRRGIVKARVIQRDVLYQLLSWLTLVLYQFLNKNWLIFVSSDCSWLSFLLLTKSCSVLNPVTKWYLSTALLPCRQEHNTFALHFPPPPPLGSEISAYDSIWV